MSQPGAKGCTVFLLIFLSWTAHTTPNILGDSRIYPNGKKSHQFHKSLFQIYVKIKQKLQDSGMQHCQREGG